MAPAAGKGGRAPKGSQRAQNSARAGRNARETRHQAGAVCPRDHKVHCSQGYYAWDNHNTNHGSRKGQRLVATAAPAHMPCEPQGGARCLGGVVFLRRDTRGARAPTHQHHVSHTLARERRRCSPESTALATGRAHKPAKGDRPVGGRVARGPRGKGRWPATLAGRLSPPPGPVGGKEPPELVCGRRLGKPCRKGWPCQYRHTTPHRVNRSWLHMLHTQGGVSVLFRRGWGQKSASPAAEPASWLRGARPRHWGQKSAGGLAGTRDGPHSKCQGGGPRAARSVMARH